MANKPNNPSLWSRAKSLAKQKFDVYPSAYANGWAAKYYKSHGGTWRKAEDGMEVPDNPGFQALPPAVQHKIMSNMSFGGYIPEMAYGGAAQQAAIAIAMKKAGKTPKGMKDGGEPNGEMALGQMAAVEDKMRKLLQFVKPDDNLDPWIASKLAVMDHSADAISDYLMYGPEANEMQEMKDGGGIPQRYKNMGFTKVGVKKESNRAGKKWMVLAKKGDQYKVVHGGYDGMKDYTQHHDKQRRENFWNRMGGKNSAKATDPFSPLYWHKRFGTWQDGGMIPEYGDGGIHINPANKGKFTASAQAAGMGVQEFAAHVLANKEDYSPTQVKRANFARNAAKWHEDGGLVEYAFGDLVPYNSKPTQDKIFGTFDPKATPFGYVPIGLPEMSAQDKMNYGMPVYASDFSSADEWEAAGMPQLSKKDLTFSGLQKSGPVTKRSDKDYNYIGAGLMNMGLSAIGGMAQELSDNRRFRYNTSDSLNPTVANTYARGRNEINTGRYADDNLVPVQFAGTPVAEQYGAPVYREMGGSFEMNNLMGLPTMIPDVSLYTGAQMNFSEPSFNVKAPETEAYATNPGRDMADYRNYIKMRESRGDYEAESKKSSAVGAYQFLWNKHNDWIKEITGVKSKQEFLKNPQAQEKAFDYWDQNTLTPTAMKIKRQTGTTDSLEQIKMKVHFAGPAGAMKYYSTGEETTDAYGTKTSTYAEGGEYDLSDAQIQEILKNGGQIEYL